MQKRFTKKRQQSSIKSTKTLPTGIYNALVNGFSSDGCGILHHQGNTLFVEGALLDEEIEFSYSEQQKGHYLGKLHAIKQVSPFRVTPKCQYYAECGGCVLQHLDSSEQVRVKREQLLRQLGRLKPVTDELAVSVISGEPWGYRRRARVGVSFAAKSQGHCVGFRAKQSNRLVEIGHCEVLDSSLSKLLTPLQNLFDSLSQPNMISHIDMMAADNGLFISLRQLKPFTEIDADKLQSFAQNYKVFIFLQSEKDGEINPFFHEQIPCYKLNTASRALAVNFLPRHFIQVNSVMNQQLVTKAIDWLELTCKDVVLDLFCGLGNFTLPMALHAKQVVGVEGSRSLVEWATKNATHNQVDNVIFQQANLAEDTRMMTWRTRFKYNKVLLDPPREGASSVIPLLSKEIKADKILYISCHSATLTRDLELLLQAGYQISKVASVAMFPQTAHSESMVLLERCK